MASDYCGPETGEHVGRGKESAPSSHVAKQANPTESFEDGDSQDPLNWRRRKKWAMVMMLSLVYGLAVIATTAIVPAAPRALDELGVHSSGTYQVLLVSIWELGEGIGPFVIAPLSERFGRLPVYHGGNILMLGFLIASALSFNISMLVAMRFFSGCTSIVLTLAPAMIGDIFVPEERGAPMAVAMGLQVVGGFVAPIIGAFITQRLSWRWSIWIVVLALATLTLLSFALIRETYAPIILKRQASGRRRTVHAPTIPDDHQMPQSETRVIHGFTLPIRLLFLSPIVSIISFYTAITYGISYTILTTITEIFETRYGFGQGVVGLVFIGSTVGGIFAMLLYGFVADRYTRYRKDRDDGVFHPEHRLIFMVLAGSILPLGLVLYGWTLEYQIHWMAPLIGTSMVGFSVVSSLLPTDNYLVDVYHQRSASAIAAGNILRSFSGAVFPLIGPPLYARLGLGWGNSVLALISLILLPLIIQLWQGGKKLRTEKLLLVA